MNVKAWPFIKYAINIKKKPEMICNVVNWLEVKGQWGSERS